MSIKPPKNYPSIHFYVKQYERKLKNVFMWIQQ